MYSLAKLGAVVLLSAPAVSAQSLPDKVVEFSGPVAEIVAGYADAFLGNSQISGEERRCLSNGASSFTMSMATVCEQALATYKQFKVQQALVTFAPSTPPAAVATPVVSTEMVSEGESAVMAMELATSLSQFYDVQSKAAKSCLTDDVLDQFKLVEKHVSNMTFVSGRLLTGGIDVMDELSTAFNAYENKNYSAFGKALGIAGRKVLLSKHSGLGDLEAPSDEAIEQVTEGLFASLFGKGYDQQIIADDAVTIASPAVSVPQAPVISAVPGASPSAQPNMTSATQPVGPGVVPPQGATSFPAPLASAPTLVPATLNIDLHKCISDNAVFWKSAWSPVLDLASAAGSGNESEVLDMDELMMSMMDVQIAMTRCNITPQMEAILIDAIEAGKLHANLQTPEAKKGDVPSLLSSAMKLDKDKQWYAFGKQLGAVMQEMLVTTLDQKYEVDATGSLRQRLQLASHKSLYAILMGAVSVGFLAIFVVVRRQRAWTAGFDRLDRWYESDLEASAE